MTNIVQVVLTSNSFAGMLIFDNNFMFTNKNQLQLGQLKITTKRPSNISVRKSCIWASINERVSPNHCIIHEFGLLYLRSVCDTFGRRRETNRSINNNLSSLLGRALLFSYLWESVCSIHDDIIVIYRYFFWHMTQLDTIDWVYSMCTTLNL